jgi:hypothetical protein
MNKKTIDKFEKEYSFLSNFYPCKIKYGNLEFQCAEALYMAHKSGNPEDFARFAPLNGAEAKKLGKTVKLQENWDEIKFDVMQKVLRLKFIRNPDLKHLLISTGDAELIEGNWWGDKIWGVCNGEGENNLGKLLMELRTEYQAKTKPMVGSVAVVRWGDYVLLGLRCGSHAPNVWGCPGGHVEYGEHPFDTVIREAKEEAGIEIEVCEDWDIGWSSNVWEKECKHYITTYIKCQPKNGPDFTNQEPDKFKEWRWFHIDNLPENLMHE